MKWFSTNRVLLLGMLLTAFTLGTIFVISEVQAKRLRTATRWVDHTQEVLHNIRALVISAIEKESTAKDYVITGNEQLLLLDTLNDRQADLRLNSLRVLVRDNRAQLALVDSLSMAFEEQTFLLHRLIKLREKSYTDSALAIFASRIPAARTARIRDITIRMEDLETSLLQQRKSNNGTNISMLGLILYGVLGLAFVFSFFTFYTLKKNFDNQKANENEFRKLLDAAPDATIAVNENGLIRTVNKQAENLFGYTKDELLNQKVELLMPAQHIEKHSQYRKEYAFTGRGKAGGEGREFPAKRKDGSQFMAEITLAPIQSSSGPLVIASIRDTTQRRQTRQRLELVSLLVEHSNEAIITVDINKNIQTWNNGAERIYGFTKEDAIGKNFVELLSVDPAAERLTGLDEKEKSYESWFGEARRKTKSGTQIIVNNSTSARKDETGQASGYISVSYDITDQKKLREQLDHLASIVEQSSEAIISRGFDKRLISWNKGAEKLMGFTREEAIGKTIAELGAMRLSEEEINEIESELTTKGCWESEKKYYCKNGSTFIGSVSGYSLKTADGKPSHFVFIIKDISERKRLEEQLKKSNQDLEAFSYSVSHDLRAPLRGIIGFTTVLEEDYSPLLDEEAQRICRIIKGNTLKMGSLIDDLLAFSRMGRHEIDKLPLNSNDLVKEAINNLEKKNNDAITWNIGDLLPAYGDPTTIRQVWINLLSNALKYSSIRAAPIVEVGSYSEDGQTVYYVRDNGVGFDQKYSNKLFKVFQRLHSTAEFEGTGVGLAIVEKIVSKHGGNVWAKGEADVGACFYFSLPVKPEMR